MGNPSPKGHWEMQKLSVRSYPHVKNYAHRAAIVLNNGSVRDIFTISGYVSVTGMFMRITQAFPATACNMAWVHDPADAGAHCSIGTAVDIQSAAVGDRFYAELDGSGLVKVAANAVMKNVLDIGDNAAALGRGLVLSPGGIDITLSANRLLTGRAELLIEYVPITLNAKIWPGHINSTTTTTSSTSSSTSSTASTSSTSSSTSSSSSSSSSTSSSSSSSSTSSSTTTTGP